MHPACVDSEGVSQALSVEGEGGVALWDRRSAAWLCVPERGGAVICGQGGIIKLWVCGHICTILPKCSETN